jgi:prefoldin subunit 5
MAELRLELANTLASLDKRTELIAQDLTAVRREMTERFEQVERQMVEGRETMLLRFEQMDQRFEQVNQRFEQVDQRFGQVDQQFARHETRLMSLENWMRTTFVTLALVAVGVAAQLFYTLLRFGLKSPTP